MRNFSWQIRNVLLELDDTPLFDKPGC